MYTTRNNSLLFALLLVLFIVSVGCGNQPNTEAIDLNRNDEVSVHDIFSDIRIVMPETHPDYLISTISLVEYHKNHYYLFDNKSQQVFCVDEKGRFQFKISAQGHGPGEYVYIGHMSIDRFNDQILLLEPSMQRLQVFDLEGQYVQAYSITAETSLAYNNVYALNDNTLLLISITADQLIYFCRDKEEIILTQFPMAIENGVFPFAPSRYSFYSFNGRNFFLPVLSQEIADITGALPQPYYAWDFGTHNNSPKQIEQLIQELRTLGSETNYKGPWDFIGRGKPISQYIVKVFETTRYKIAIVEFENDYKHVIIDKKEGTHYVFKGFKEGISLLYLNLFWETAIGSAADLDYVPVAMQHRILSRFHPSVLSETEKLRLNHWDEMKDNVFFVVYKFKE